MTDPNQIAVTVGEPNWAPLERAVPATELENFMYMCCAGEIELYKHRFTRRYLNIEQNSERFYRYLNGEYVEIARAAALEYVRS
jgi:2-phosphoglycerate kinase